jgi:hypothetical protein
MRFSRHREIYPPMGAPNRWANAPAHRRDEFPAGYFLAGCAPAEPTSASPAAFQYALQSFCRSRIFQRTARYVLTVCVSRPYKRSRRHNDFMPMLSEGWPMPLNAFIQAPPTTLCLNTSEASRIATNW